MIDWTRINQTLPRSPKLRVMMRVMKTKDRDSALGFAVRWLIFVDEQTTDGRTKLTPDELDDELDRKNATEALRACGWAVVDEEDGTVCAVDFDKYCGVTAKQRAENGRRVHECRDRARHAKNAQQAGGGVTENHYTCNDSALQQAGGGVTEKTLREYRYRDRDNKGDSKATVCSAGEAQADGQGSPAPTPCMDGSDAFSLWLYALCEAHPGTRRCRRVNGEPLLPQDVYEAARAAFERFPDAPQHAELLTAFFAARVDYIGEKERFYRPTGQRQFFADLEDAVSHAQRWAKFSGWKPAGAVRKRPQGAGAVSARNEGKTPAEETAMSHTEVMQAWEEIKKEGGSDGLQG